MKRVLLPFVMLFLVVSSAAAQSDRGRIAGTVYDTSGGVLPHAIVTATSLSTQASRQVEADDKGIFAIDDLLPTTYEVVATMPGFAEVKIGSIVLGAGQEQTLQFRLPLQGVAESVAVSAQAPIVDTTSAHIGVTVSDTEVQNLPLNGRQVAQLYLLVPGASSTGSGTFDDMRFAGRANEQNVVRYDGIEGGTMIDANPGDVNGASAGSTSFRLSQSLENIQEFHVEATNYNAEQGRGTGGQVTIITKSGSNEFHGTAFENIRNNRFDARNHFDTGVTPAPLNLSQFGGGLGGPIMKDRLFFYAADENLLQKVSVPFRASTLSAFARAQAVPAIQPALAAFPMGATPTSSPFFDLVTANLPSNIKEHFWNARVDAHINSSNTAYFRFSHDQGTSNTPSDVSGSSAFVSTLPRNAIGDLTTIISSRVVNDLKVGYNAEKSNNARQGVNLPNLNLSNVTLSIGGAAQSGSTGIVTPTGAGSTPLVQAMTYDNHEWELIDNLSWNRGAHGIKLGGEFNPRTIYPNQLGGIVYTFPTVQAFLADQPSRIQLSSDLDQQSPFHPGSSGLRQGLQWFTGAYIQDQWQAKSNVTINYGLRYDYFSVLREAHNRGVGVNTFTGALEDSGEPFFASSKTNFGPRGAFTWAPAAFHGNSVLKAGSGLYYGPGQEEDQTQSLVNDFIVTTLTSGNIAYPVDRPALLATWNPNDPNAGFQPRAYAANYVLPETVASYTVNWQQSLPGQSTLTVGYVGSRGWNLFQRTISNRITGVATDPVTGTAVLTREFGNRYAEMDVKTSHGYNHYNGLVTTWNRRFSKGLTAVLNYTLSHNIGTSGGSNEATTTENNYTFASEYGDNSSDIRHYLQASAVWDLPYHTAANGGSGVLHGIFGDWQLATSFNARSGLPLNVTVSRPDVVYFDPQNGQYYTSPVVSNGVVITQAVPNIPGGGSSRGTQRPNLVPGVDPYVSTAAGYYLNPAAFTTPAPGTYGTMPRNGLRGPRFNQLDLSFTKRIPFGGSRTFELRADVYNIFNRVNLANPSTVLSAALPSSPTATGTFLQPGQPYTSATAGSGFGLFSSTVGRYVDMGTARQMQFTFRVRF
jgi:hypothetical protein